MNHTIISGSIIFGALLIAGSIWFSGSTAGPKTAVNSPAPAATPPSVEVPNRSRSAYSYGSTDATIVVTEYSDLECPFCARLHETLKTLVDKSNNTIRWEYRHLPLPGHTNAEPAAIASECVGRQLGDSAFFSYLDKLFASIGQFSETFFVREAVALGVKEKDFRTCLTDPAVLALIDEDRNAAGGVGAQGTPFSLVTGPDGKSQVVSGALPLANWESIINGLK